MKTSLSPRHCWVCLLVALLSFLLLAAAVSFGVTDAFDEAVRVGLNRLATPQITRINFLLSFFGSTAFLLVLTTLSVLALCAHGHRKPAMALGSAFVVAVVLNNVVKLMFLRNRPEAYFGSAPESFSFASGHALLSTSFYGLMATIVIWDLGYERYRAGIGSFVCTLVGGIGLSRVYLGVHHLTDVLAGYALGILILCAARLRLERSR